MPTLSSALRFGATPVFLTLAAILYASGMHGHTAHPGDICLAAASPSPTGVVVTGHLGSMWFMYLLMGMFHLTPWLKVVPLPASERET